MTETHESRSEKSKPARGRSRIALAFTRVIGPRLLSFLEKPQRHRRLQFASLEVPPNRVVFLGDSISEGGLWEEWFPYARVLNRGVSGETSAQVVTRLDSAIAQPAAVLLLIGTNDLTIAVPPADIVANIRSILDGIETRAPGTEVWVQSVMPRTSHLLPELQSLNSSIAQMVAASGEHVRYLNLWPILAANDGSLREDFSLDRLHLNGDGYRAWSNHLRQVVPSLAER